MISETVDTVNEKFTDSFVRTSRFRAVIETNFHEFFQIRDPNSTRGEHHGSRVPLGPKEIAFVSSVSRNSRLTSHAQIISSRECVYPVTENPTQFMPKQQSLHYPVTKYGSLCDSIRIIPEWSGERSIALNETRQTVREQHGIEVTMFSRVHYTRRLRNRRGPKISAFHQRPGDAPGSFEGLSRTFPKFRYPTRLMVNSCPWTAPGTSAREESAHGCTR